MSRYRIPEQQLRHRWLRPVYWPANALWVLCREQLIRVRDRNEWINKLAFWLADRIATPIIRSIEQYDRA